ncbi:hypothetical protein LR48_Vigan511s006100 [Vigna angularis]|uniref:TPX2 C-terminal domain-containing protein n=1 Tax=Phaseolus angularis TaxID=3914 RepID=A0A0L9TCG8_PHAAN|nr:hypothetical protein LR48_Vigan511s006100 [Vigna angularis]
MGETAASNPALQVSVSFGRFENDSLSWEKWSAFSPNKYLEEVEKCATPGSVAQKKAYFEAHYKNVAARKAELLAQEKQTEKASVKTQYQNDEDLSCNSCVTDAECDISNAQGSSEGVKQEINSVGEIVRTDVSNLEYAAVSRDYQGSSVEGEKVNDKLERRSGGGSLIEKKQEEVVCVEQGGSKEESPNIEAEGLKEVSHNVNNEPVKASEIEAQYKTLDNPKASKKVTPVSRESNATKGKKKSVQPTSKPKASRISTPRNPKPSSTPTKTFASASSTKKEISPSISGRETASTAENRKVPNKTLHMSLSLGPSQSEPAPRTTVRKSLIMERMGDKDIVKRAFKTFQNNFNQPKTSGENKSLVKEKVSPKVDSAGKRSGNTARTAFGLKTDVKAEKGKEFPRKIEENFYAKEVERTHHQSKSKEEKIKHNIKATSLPAFHQGQKASKNHSQKVCYCAL